MVGQNVTASPQTHINHAASFIEKGCAADAAEEVWLASSCQLKCFLRLHMFAVNSYQMKDNVVMYLKEHCAIDSEELINSWDVAYAYVICYNLIIFYDTYLA